MDVQEKTAADSATISRDIVCLSCSAPITMGFDIMVSLVTELNVDRLDLSHTNYRYSIRAGMTICNS